MIYKTRIFLTALVILGLGAGGVWGWAQHKAPEKNPADSNSKKGKGPVTVVLGKSKREAVDITVRANGLVSAIATVDVRPQITSSIKTVHVKEGQFVKAGDLLFSLDDRADVANLSKLNAQLLKDKATLADIQRQHNRSIDLLAKNFISQSAADTTLSQLQAQQAVVAASEAAVVAGKVSLGYQTITAPQSGRIGAINVFRGSLIQPTVSLLTITQLNPINIAFSLPEQYLQDLLKQRNISVLVPPTTSDSKPLKGKLQFIDNAVDSQAGTIKLKAQFDNAQQTLWPGQFVTVALAVQHMDDATTLPMSAVVTSPAGTLVYTIDDQMQAKPVNINIIAQIGEKAVVSGVEPDVSIVIDGKQNLKPGSVVKESR